MSTADTGIPTGLSIGSGLLYNPVATGNTTSAAFSVGGLAQVVAYISSSDAMTATLSFQGSVDDSAYFAIEGTAMDGSISATSTTAVGAFKFDTAGLSSIKFVISGYAAGHIQVACRGTSAAGGGGYPPIGSVTTSENLARVNGATVLTGNGTTGTGAQRVVVASDNTPFPVKVDQTTPGATNAVALAQVGAAAALAGNGNTGTGSLRVTVAADNSPIPVQATTSNTTLLASAARTTTQVSADQTNTSGKYMHLILDVTANPGLGSLTVHVRGKDPASGVYYDILNGAAVTGNTTNVYRIGPGLSPSPNAVANDIVPRTFQVEVTAATADSYTYSVGYSLVGA